MTVGFFGLKNKITEGMNVVFKISAIVGFKNMIGLHFSEKGPLAFFFSKRSLIVLPTPKTGYESFAS